MKNERKKASLKEFGTECKRRRMIAGKTLEQIADSLDLSITAIWRFEHGENDSLYIALCYMYMFFYFDWDGDWGDNE